MTGVLVMPEGSMLPQGSEPPLIGVPRCCCQASAPVAASKE
jgi:hypothetical protein